MSITAENKAILEEKRTTDILNAAKKLFYIKSYTATSLDEVAAEAGISKALIYHYFKNKAALIIALNEGLDEYLKELEEMPDAEKALKRFGVDFLVHDEELYHDVPPTQICLTTFANGEVPKDEFEDEKWLYGDFGREFFGKLFEKAITAGQFPVGDAETYGDIFWSFLLGKLLSVKKGNEKKEPAFYVNEILDILRR